MEFSIPIFCVFILLILIKFIPTRFKQSTRQTEIKLVPNIPYSFPLFGHALYVTFLPRRFFQYCYSHYGDIFKIRIFSSNIAIVCNKALVSEIYKSAESHLSLYNHLEHVFIGEANGVKISVRTAIIKKATVRMGSAEMVAGINNCVSQFMERIDKSSTQNGIDLKDELLQFVIRTTASCLLGVQFTDDMVQEFKDFNNLQNFVISATRVLPIKLARFMFAKRLIQEKSEMWKEFRKQIRLHRENSDLRDSPIVRAAVDATDDNTGRHLDENEICFILMGLLFASTGNTTLCLLHTLLELFKHPQYLQLAIIEVDKLLDNSGNYEGVLNSNYLHGCILDAARLNTNIIVAERSPDQKDHIGDYYIGDCELVAIAGTLNHVDGTAGTVFSYPNNYNPERYKLQNNDKLQSRIISWGAGVHACPGRLFAIAMAKILVSNFLKIYTIRMDKTTVSPPNFMSHSAFVDLDVRSLIERRKVETD